MTLYNPQNFDVMVENAKITKLAIVEDREDVLDFLKNIFAETSDFELIKTYNNAEDAIKFLPKTEAKIVIVDIGLPGENGIEVVKQVKALRSDLQFMMYTVFDKNDEIFESLRAGASGYLLKTPYADKILRAVRELVNGGAPMTPAIAKRVTDYFFKGPKPFKELGLLTKRQLQILELLADGYLYKEIANKLEITEGTVKQHIHNIYQKLHVTNRTEAINKYLGRD